MITQDRMNELYLQVGILWAAHRAEKPWTRDEIIESASELLDNFEGYSIDDFLNLMKDDGVPDWIIQDWINSCELKGLVKIAEVTIN